MRPWLLIASWLTQHNLCPVSWKFFLRSDLVSAGELPGPRVPDREMLHQQEGATWTWGTDKAQASGANLSRGGGHLPTSLPASLRLSELGFAVFWNMENGGEKGEPPV